ncbi:hypothetical protein IV500_10535 [Paeniglutamicibacter antarcticus]|uniref:Uncharacterized protein n=1 Tax=Arthrobacter terrae TaxID=2935737 RepID=A0A931CPN8_9MICC|nr:hypothetical protein [Arthrobacter terrae]MBG0739821.1 hypothetical protein [Arthrobacter terrae]
MRPAAAPEQAPRSTGLNLNRPGVAQHPAPVASRPPATAGSDAAAPVRRPPASVTAGLFRAPGIRDVMEIGPTVPMFRLNPLQSGIGTLIVTGTTAIAWEAAGHATGAHLTGALTRDGNFAGTAVETAGNRPLAGYLEGEALVPLRHLQELRRALFIGRGPEPLGMHIFDGAAATLPAPTGNTMFVLALLRVDNLIELRAEPVPAGMNDQDIWAEFGFSMTRKVTVQGNRGR